MQHTYISVYFCEVFSPYSVLANIFTVCTGASLKWVGSGLCYLTPFFFRLQMLFVSFCKQLLQIPLNFSTAIDRDGPRLEQQSAIEKLQTNAGVVGKEKKCRQPVGFCCTHWDHFIWTEVQYELKEKLLSF